MSNWVLTAWVVALNFVLFFCNWHIFFGPDGRNRTFGSRIAGKLELIGKTISELENKGLYKVKDLEICANYWDGLVVSGISVEDTKDLMSDWVRHYNNMTGRFLTVPFAVSSENVLLPCLFVTMETTKHLLLVDLLNFHYQVMSRFEIEIMTFIKGLFRTKKSANLVDISNLINQIKIPTHPDLFLYRQAHKMLNRTHHMLVDFDRMNDEANKPFFLGYSYPEQ